MRNRFFSVLTIAVMLFAVSATASAADVHSIGSNSVFRLYDIQYNIEYTTVTGNTVVSWFDGTTSGYCHADVYAYASPWTKPVHFVFDLVDVWSTNDDEIWGAWDIYRNGVLIQTSQPGEAVGLDSAIGDYFKLHITPSFVPPPGAITTVWYLIPWIDTRFDY